MEVDDGIAMFPQQSREPPPSDEVDVVADRERHDGDAEGGGTRGERTPGIGRERLVVSSRLEMGEEREHLALATAEPTLGIDVEDGEWSRIAHGGGTRGRVRLASHSLAYLANT